MKLVYRYLGYLLLISAVFRLVPIAMALVLGESIFLFALSMVLSLLIGGLLVYLFRYHPDEKDLFSLRNGLVLSAVSFVLIPLFGAISYLPTLDYHFLNAYFESVSGFTTTGLTVYHDLDGLPKSLLIWRAMTQWFGGIGIVTIFLFIFSHLHYHDNINLKDIQSESLKTVKLFQAGGFASKAEGDFRGSLQNLLLAYMVYTFAGVLLLWLAGLPAFQAFGLAFTSISTGGFSMTTHFTDDATVLLILSVLMLLGATSFIAHNKLFLGKIKEFIQSFEKNLMFAIILTFSLIALIVFPQPKVVFFTIVSAFTTSGFSILDVKLLPELFILFIMIGMMMGGTFASTSGGMKIFRIHYLLKTIPWSIRKLASPARAIIPLKIQQQPVDEAKLVNIGIFVFTYLLILFLGTLVFMLFGHSFFDSAFQIFSALGTVGLQSMDLVALNAMLKLLLIVVMLFGRLEIFPLLILLRVIFKRKFL